MSDDDDPFSILRHQKVNGIEQFDIDNISQPFQPMNDLVQIPAVLVEQASNIFKHPQFRVKLFHGCCKRWKTVSRIFKT